MNLSSIATKKNLATAGICAAAAYLALQATSDKSKWWQGGAMVAAVALALPASSMVTSKL